MAIKGLGQITMSAAGPGVDSTTYYYYLSNSSTAPTKPNTYTPSSPWTTEEPAYQVGDTDYLYTVIRTVYKDNTYEYSNVNLSSSYEAIKQTYQDIVSAEQDINVLKNLGLNRGYIWQNTTQIPAHDNIPVYYPGAYVASGILGTDFDTTNSDTYGLNTWTSSSGIKMRYNAIDLASLSTSALEFYYPSMTQQGSKAVWLGVENTIPALIFYSFTSNGSVGEEAMRLTPSGMKLSRGGIEAGSINTSDYIYVWSHDGDVSHTLDINNSGDKDDWRIVAGNNFGVDKSGNLYAANANISGTINATDGSISDSVTLAYITKIDANGIRIHPASTINNSILLNANGLEIFKGGTAAANSVAFYGDTARIGKPNNTRVEIASNGITMYNGTTQVAQYGSIITLGNSNSGSSDYYLRLNANSSSGASITVGRSGSEFFDIQGEIIDSTKCMTLGILSGSSIFLNDDSVVFHLKNDASFCEFNKTFCGIGSAILCSSYIESRGHQWIRLVASKSSSSYKGLYDPNNEKWMWCLKYGETDRYRTAGHIMPNSDNALYMGLANNRWKAVYAANGTIQTSDIKVKDILGTIDYAEDLIMGLEPVDFMWKDGDHRRKRMGFKAQQSAQLCKELNQNLAFVTATYKEDDDLPYYGEDVDDELLNWGMVKEELIAPLVKVVQNQQKEIQKLKTQVQNLSLMIQGE